MPEVPDLRPDQVVGGNIVLPAPVSISTLSPHFRRVSTSKGTLCTCVSRTCDMRRRLPPGESSSGHVAPRRAPGAAWGLLADSGLVSTGNPSAGSGVRAGTPARGHGRSGFRLGQGPRALGAGAFLGQLVLCGFPAPACEVRVALRGRRAAELRLLGCGLAGWVAPGFRPRRRLPIFGTSRRELRVGDCSPPSRSVARCEARARS